MPYYVCVYTYIQIVKLKSFLGRTSIAWFMSRGYENIDDRNQNGGFAELSSFNGPSTFRIPSGKKNETIAIFGACGYVGSYLTLYLRSAGYKVFAFDMDPKVQKVDCKKMHSNSIKDDELR